MSEEQLLRCADCHTVMRRVEEMAHPKLQVRFLDLYECTNAGCARRCFIQWEKPDGSLTDEDLSWVEREVLNKGSWFPRDSGFE